MFSALGELLTHPNFTCDICGCEVFDEARICTPCLDSLPYNYRYCARCGRPSEDEGLCIDCRALMPEFDVARSVLVHCGKARSLVLRYKNGGKYLLTAASELLCTKLPEFSDAECVAFVPMTKKAERMRGYNQSRLIAEKIAEALSVPIFTELEKIKETKPQKSLGYNARKENIKGCFKVVSRRGLKGKRVLLVDDTLTTGSTAGEIAKVLKSAGADKVYVLTITSVPCRTITL